MNAHSLPAQPDARNIAIFRARCEARSLLCALGELELQSTVDELQRFAEQLGLPATVGQDEVQRLITESLGRERWKGSAREYREQPRARPSTPWQLNGGSAPTAPDVGPVAPPSFPDRGH